MKPEHISGTTPRKALPDPIRRRPEDNDKFQAARGDAVAFALGHIKDPMVSLFGRVKVAGDPSDSGPIERDLLYKIVCEYGNQWIPKWKGPGKPKKTHKKDTIRAVVRIALFEELYGPVCPECCGKRWQANNKDTCIRCAGRGVSRWTDIDRAEMLGMKYRAFTMTWSQRVKVVKSYINQYTEIIERVRL